MEHYRTHNLGGVHSSEAWTEEEVDTTFSFNRSVCVCVWGGGGGIGDFPWAKPLKPLVGLMDTDRF